MSERETIMDLIRNEYDPKPNLGRGDYPAFEWDDGAGRIADAILADKALLVRKHAEANDALVKALERLADERHNCGCQPCVGQCRSQEALQISIDEMREIARTALAAVKSAS